MLVDHVLAQYKVTPEFDLAGLYHEHTLCPAIASASTKHMNQRRRWYSRRDHTDQNWELSGFSTVSDLNVQQFTNCEVFDLVNFVVTNRHTAFRIGAFAPTCINCVLATFVNGVNTLIDLLVNFLDHVIIECFKREQQGWTNTTGEAFQRW
ncbi:hypothetical protein D3C75_975910 [compost metagenome]